MLETLPNLRTARIKIAEYMTSPKPERVKRLLEKNSSGANNAPPGLGILLSSKDRLPSGWSSTGEQFFCASLQRLLPPMMSLFELPPGEINGMLGVRNLQKFLVIYQHHFPKDEVTPLARQVTAILYDLLWSADKLARSVAPSKGGSDLGKIVTLKKSDAAGRWKGGDLARGHFKQEGSKLSSWNRSVRQGRSNPAKNARQAGAPDNAPRKIPRI